MTGLEIVVVMLGGLVLGSFATALSYRMPRDISIITVRRSHCPSCNASLGVLDLVPVLSWIFLRGKCRHCRAKIGLQYPMIEMGTVALCLLFYMALGLSVESALVFLLAPVLVSIIDIDFRFKIIPDELNLAIFWIGLAAFLVNVLWGGFVPEEIWYKASSAIGGVLAYGFGSFLLSYIVSKLMKREAMGWGDIKFYAATGFWLGISLEAAALFMFVSGITGTANALIWKKVTGDDEAPFGPALIIGFIAALYIYSPSFMRV